MKRFTKSWCVSRNSGGRGWPNDGRPFAPRERNSAKGADERIALSLLAMREPALPVNSLNEYEPDCVWSLGI